MSSLNIKQLKQLYDNYSPLKTNKELLKTYQDVTRTNSINITQIRETYNQKIVANLLNEAVIKSAFIKRFSFQKSPRQTITIFELNAGSSRADICLFNGKSMVFEIKTVFDTFNRLDNQLESYGKLFEFITVIVPSSNINVAIKCLNASIGIITYRLNRLGNISFKTFRAPKYNAYIDSRAQLSQLTIKQLRTFNKTLLHANKKDLVNYLIETKTKKEINKIYNTFIKNKYRKKWNYLYNHRELIKPLDYQWFFKNNLSTSLVYK